MTVAHKALRHPPRTPRQFRRPVKDRSVACRWAPISLDTRDAVVRMNDGNVDIACAQAGVG